MNPSDPSNRKKKHGHVLLELCESGYNGYLTIEIDDKAFLKPYPKKKNTGTERRKGISGTVFVTSA